MMSVRPDTTGRGEEAARAEAHHLLFIHIPKTAGTTLRHALADLYPPDQRAFIYGPRVEGSVSMQHFLDLSAKERAPLRLVMGHYGFGLHRWLPGPSRYVTMLREPMDRIVSLFHYYRTGRFPPDSKPAREQAVLVDRGTPIDEWIFRNREPRWDNHMVRLLAGARGVGFGECTDALLGEALAHVEEHFEALLLLEWMPLSMEMLAAIVGQPIPDAPRHNVGADRPAVADIDPAALRRIRELNRLDLGLYRWAQERLPFAHQRFSSRP
jgi:hypothetical protein